MIDRAPFAFALALVWAGGAGGLGACAGPPAPPGDAPPATTAPAAIPTPTPTPMPDAAPADPSGAPATLAVTVRATYPHDPDAFTQGLLVDGDRLFESTGLHGRSSVREVEIASGRVLRRQDLPEKLFGEGLAEVGDRLFQLTWQSGLALAWERDTFTRRGELSYPGEGWGLTSDGHRLVMSDGSSWLVFRDPETFAELGRVEVTLSGRPLSQLNELEWVDGAVWANVWQSLSIVRIDPETGEVTGVADCSALEARLPPAASGSIDVLNGIAWWPSHRSFLVTGKLWPRMFEVTFDEP